MRSGFVWATELRYLQRQILKKIAERLGPDVIVDDDVAVEDSTYTAGRRGVAARSPLQTLPLRFPQPGGGLEGPLGPWALGPHASEHSPF